MRTDGRRTQMNGGRNVRTLAPLVHWLNTCVELKTIASFVTIGSAAEVQVHCCNSIYMLDSPGFCLWPTLTIPFQLSRRHLQSGWCKNSDYKQRCLSTLYFSGTGKLEQKKRKNNILVEYDNLILNTIQFNSFRHYYNNHLVYRVLAYNESLWNILLLRLQADW